MTERNLTSDRLKEAVLEDLIDRIENGETVVVAAEKTTDDGALIPAVTDRVPAPAPLISAAINFLKTFPPDVGGDLQSDGLSKTLKQYGEKMRY